jgi:hypothetical protein
VVSELFLDWMWRKEPVGWLGEWGKGVFISTQPEESLGKCQNLGMTARLVRLPRIRTKGFVILPIEEQRPYCRFFF